MPERAVSMPNESSLRALALMPCVPARHFDLSKRFYLDVGFSIVHDSQKAAELELGDCRFILQNFYDDTRGQPCMLELFVADLDSWWRHLGSLDLPGRYNVREPQWLSPPDEQASVLMHDPSGVVWHITQPVLAEKKGGVPMSNNRHTPGSTE